MRALRKMRHPLRWAVAVWILCSGLHSRGGQVLEIGRNFTGSVFDVNSFALPADGNGVVGPDHFVEFINGRFSVYAKTNGARVLTKTDRQFWTSGGVSFSAATGVTDPRLIYDPTVQRWFASAVDVDGTAFNPVNNRFLLAVSASASPTGNWNAMAFLADPANGNFADFPTLGLDAQGVYLAGDMFDEFGNEFGSTLVAIPKADLLLSNPTITNRTWFGILDASYGCVLQPSVNFGPFSGGEKILAVGDCGTELPFSFHSNVVSFVVTNASAPASAGITAPTNLWVSPYFVPINPPQPDLSSNLDNGDARFSATVHQVGGIIYAVHNIEVNPRASIRWYKINATNDTLLQSGTITDANLDLIYPSIAANTNGTVVIGCNGCSRTTFVSSYAVLGETVNGITTFGNLVLLKAGVASYQFPDNSGNSRWGDYSATSVDPNDPTHFWTLQMYASGPDAWSTQITELHVVDLKLSIAQSGANLLLTYPAGAADYHLQSTLNLSATNVWSPVAQLPFPNNNQLSVLVPRTNNAAFYRLQKP